MEPQGIVVAVFSVVKAFASLTNNVIMTYVCKVL